MKTLSLRLSDEQGAALEAMAQDALASSYSDRIVDMDDQPSRDVAQEQVSESLQDILDASWRSAVESAREGVESLRLISPELVQHLSESTCREISNAIGDFEGALKKLHSAGKSVIGENAYTNFLDEHVKSKTGSS